MQINDFKWILKFIQIFYISLACYGFVRMYCATDPNTSFLVIKLRIYHMMFEKPEIFWGEVKRIVWIKERLPWAERLDHLQSVFDFCLFTAVVVPVTERWSPIKQYSLSSLDIRVKLIQLTAFFDYVDTAWKSAGLLDVGLLWSPLITTPCCNHIKFSFDLDEWMLKTSCMNL